MSSFLFALKAVSPIVLAVALGYFLKRIGIIPEKITKHLNRLVFRVFLPCNLFLNVYSITDLGSISLFYVVYVLAATLVIFLLSIPVALLTTKEGARRGVLMQGGIRSNYALIGIPLATSLFGQEGAIVATVLSAFAIPFFNVL
ncbi:MAG: AEC family transporter, partial [Clostridia bacterium]|nr:AEC family transporter [Clostridia bacterium]